MRLYLVQHGRALTDEQDPDRPLTDDGAADVRRVAELARSAGAGGSVQSIVHSGKTRARQTAEIWAEALAAPVEPADGLSPMDDPSVWAERLSGRRDRPEDLMLVGHMPHLGRLTCLLVAGDAERPVVAYRPGALVVVEPVDDGWSVGLVLPPPASWRSG